MPQGRRWQLPPQNGVAVRTFRELTGTKTNELAGKIGISESHLRNIELEYRSATRENIARIADSLGVPVAAITRYPATHNTCYDPPPCAADDEESPSCRTP